MLQIGKTNVCNGTNKVLNAPVHLGSMAANLESNVEDIKSIWVNHRDDSLVSIVFKLLEYYQIIQCLAYASSFQKVDAKKLEKAQAKLQEKQEKRSKDGVRAPTAVKLESATASQVRLLKTIDIMVYNEYFFR